MKRIAMKIKWKKLIIWVVVLAVIAAAVNMGLQRMRADFVQSMAAQEVINTAKVEIRDIQKVLSSSGIIQPLNTYEVTTLVQGEIIAADFEEGDLVEEGQVLYQVTTDNLDSEIETAQTSLDRAKKNLTKAEKSYSEAQKEHQDALDEYNKALKKYGNPELLSRETGIVKALYVKEGDTVQAGTQIAQIYDNSSMLLVLPFSAAEADSSLIGKKAEITIVATDETLSGVVTKVSTIDEVLSGSRLVRQVTIQVENPGGLTGETAATAVIGSNIYSIAEGTFGVLTDTVIKADSSGEIGELMIEEGSKIKTGDPVYRLTDETIDDLLESYRNKIESAQKTVDNARDSMETAEESIEDAQTKLQEIIDTRSDYSITAPISGRIVSKGALVGDTIKSNSVNSSLCTIYDLSAVTFEMSVDELDVKNVKAGQEVNVSADAYEGEIYHGIVTNVSLLSTTSQGVTEYPVTVKLTEAGELLPGMNVTGEIVIEKAEQAIAIPSDALMRGNVVYVEDPAAVAEEEGIPAGFRQVRVETGITDGDYVEVISGLTGEETVYVQRISQALDTFIFPEGGVSFQMQDGSGQGSFPGGTRGGRNGGGMNGGGMPGGR